MPIEKPQDNQLTAEELAVLETECEKWWSRMQHTDPGPISPERLAIAMFRQGWRWRHRMSKEGYNPN
jgi:hypothetical protein